MWWDIRYMHEICVEKGEKMCFADWRRWFVRIVSLDALSDEVIHRPPQDLASTVCSTRAVFSFFSQSFIKNKLGSLHVTYLQYMRSCAHVVDKATRHEMPIPLQECLVERGGQLQCLRGGRISGLRTCIDALLQRGSERIALSNIWKNMLELEIIDEEFDQPTHAVGDVVCYLTNYSRVRRKSGCRIKRLKGNILSLITSMRQSVLDWFASRIDVYMQDWYQRQTVVTTPPPSLKQNSPTKAREVIDGDEKVRPYKLLPVETIWEIFQDARRTNSSISNVLKIRQNDEHAGNHHSCEQWWMRKYHSLYDR